MRVYRIDLHRAAVAVEIAALAYGTADADGCPYYPRHSVYGTASHYLTWAEAHDALVTCCLTELERAEAGVVGAATELSEAHAWLRDRSATLARVRSITPTGHEMCKGSDHTC